MDFDTALARCPLVAILRGVQPDEVVEIGTALADAGVTIVEVPLNSPRPLDSLRLLAAALSGRALVGAGTVLSPQAAQDVAATGAGLAVMPHADPQVIRAAKAAGLACLPGAATPTEAIAALGAGADALKMFPAEALPPAVLKAWSAVLPRGTRLLPVGGIEPASLAPYLAAGAAGFGLGSALYRPGDAAATVAERARAFVAAWRHSRGSE